MCHCIGKILADIIKSATVVLACIFFIAAVVPQDPVLTGTPSLIQPQEAFSLPQYNSYGVAVFYAGIGYPTISNGTRSELFWSDLNSANTCGNGTSIFELWAKPMNVCFPCNSVTSNDGYCFARPAEVFAQQGILLVALLLTGIWSIWRIVAIFCTINYICRIVDGVFAILSLVFATATFPIWKTLPMANTLQNEGGHVPVISGNTIVASDFVVMTTTHGYSIMVVGFVLTLFSALLCFLVDFACCCPSRARQDDNNGGCCGRKAKKEENKDATQAAAASAVPADEAAKAGCCAALCCCFRKKEQPKNEQKKPSETSSAAPATGSATTTTAASTPPTTKEGEKVGFWASLCACCACCAMQKDSKAEKRKEESVDIEAQQQQPDKAAAAGAAGGIAGLCACCACWHKEKQQEEPPKSERATAAATSSAPPAAASSAPPAAMPSAQQQQAVPTAAAAVAGAGAGVAASSTAAQNGPQSASPGPESATQSSAAATASAVPVTNSAAQPLDANTEKKAEKSPFAALCCMKKDEVTKPEAANGEEKTDDVEVEAVGEDGEDAEDGEAGEDAEDEDENAEDEGEEEDDGEGEGDGEEEEVAEEETPSETVAGKDELALAQM